MKTLQNQDELINEIKGIYVNWMAHQFDSSKFHQLLIALLEDNVRYDDDNAIWVIISTDAVIDSPPLLDIIFLFSKRKMDVHRGMLELVSRLGIIDVTEDFEKESPYITEAKEKDAKEKKAQMLQEIETLKTAATFINATNAHGADDCIEMIGHLNRLIKSRLSYITEVLKNQNDEDADLFARSCKSETLAFIRTLTK